MSKHIHKTAIISSGAEISDDTYVGPYTIIGENVVLGKNVKIHSHVVIDGFTSIDDNTEIFPFATLGLKPQHSKYKGEPSRLIIGKNNIIREHVTMHTGTNLDAMETKVGNNGLFLVGVHIAHDCIIGDNVIFANNVGLGGHVKVGNNVYLGAYAAIHQFVRIGSFSIVGGQTGIVADIIPYGSASGPRGSLNGINNIGLKRQGYEKNEISILNDAYNMIFSGDDIFKDRIKNTKKKFKKIDIVNQLIEFIEADRERPLCQPKLNNE